MRIVRLEVEDFKRIEAIEIRPEGEAVEITGKNEQGKSSVLDAIEAALGGKRHQPQEPIRRGAERARIVLDLGDLVVERVWTERTDRLLVKNPEGAIFPRGQEKLEALFNSLAFDPLAFLRQGDREQREQLLELIGVDLEAFDTERKTLYDQRRDTGRDLRQAEAELAAAAEPEGEVPEDEVSIQAVTAELEEVNRKVAENATIRQALVARRGRLEQAEETAESRREAVAAARRTMEQAELQLKAAEEQVALQKKAVAEDEKRVSKLKEPDAAAVKTRLAGAEELNRKVRQRQARATLSKRVADLTAAVDRVTKGIEAVDQKKATALQKAKMPVAGLEVTEEGLTWKGTPLSQEALSRRVRICTAISAALNPELKIALVRDGNDLDDEVLAAFYDEAKAAGLEQVWVERRTGIGEHAIEIVAGRLGSEAGAEETITE